MNWAEISAVGGAITVVIGLATFLTVKVVPWMRKWSRVADRILGVPADPKTGQEAVKSIWEVLDHQNSELAVIKHEVEYNNSTSLKDAVRRTENATTEIGKKLDDYIDGKTTNNTNVTIVTPAAAP